MPNLITRYQYFQESSLNFFSTKSLFIGKAPAKLNNIIIQAGLYKPAGLLTQHTFLLVALSGSKVTLETQLHGKRQKRTNMLSTILYGIHRWGFTDKFVHEFFTSTVDYKTPKFKKGSRLAKSFSLRVRQKLSIIPDFHDLVSAGMYDTYRGIYLPLTVHFNLNHYESYLTAESYLHMLRLPISFFRRRGRPAFDDTKQAYRIA